MTTDIRSKQKPRDDETKTKQKSLTTKRASMQVNGFLNSIMT